MRIPPYHHAPRSSGPGDLTGIWVVCGAGALATVIALIARALIGE